MLVAKRSLQCDLTKEAPIWACDQLENGKDSHHLRILAGLSPADGAWEIESECDRTFAELGITIPPPKEALSIYALELAEDYLSGNLSKDYLLHTLCQMCIDADYETALYPFYTLRWTWDDLKEQGWSFYDRTATCENFDDLLRTEIGNLGRSQK